MNKSNPSSQGLDRQIILENEKVVLSPLTNSDFEALFSVAADPLIWEQHPNPDRWQKEVFKGFFDGAIQSGGAYKIVDKNNGQVIGSTRMYDYEKENNLIRIGYTFYARSYWGSGLNHEVKKLMMDYLFQFVDIVEYHVGAKNIRSQTSITRLGVKKTGEKEVAYVGEPPRLNFIYQMHKDDWIAFKNK